MKGIPGRTIALLIVLALLHDSGQLLAQDKTADRVLKATVFLECAADSLPYEKQRPHPQGSGKSNDKGIRDARVQGIALFLKHEGKRYLITARDVLADVTAGHGGLVGPGARSSDPIYYMIYRIPLKKNAVPKKDSRPPQSSSGDKGVDLDLLMNLECGPEWMHPYSFSDKEIGLAIISLDVGIPKQIFKFGDRLQSLGYSPLSLADIADGPSNHSDDITLVGQWEKVEEIGTNLWRAGCSAQPLPPHNGKAAPCDQDHFMVHEVGTKPWDRGAPVIQDGKIVGLLIRSGQADHLPIAATGRSIRQLLETQMNKDALSEKIWKTSLTTKKPVKTNGKPH